MGTPVSLKHCVRAVAAKYDGDASKAFAICTASLQKAGMLKAGTQEPTAKGKKADKKHAADPDSGEKLADYEKVLAANRKEQTTPRFVADMRTLLDAKEVATADHLPEDPWKYFIKEPGAELIPVSKLRTIRARPDGIAHAGKYMAMAYNGEGKKRGPITLRAEDDGTYTVLDGNSTTARARDAKWKFIVGKVETGEKSAHEGLWSLIRVLQVLREEALEEEAYKPGTIRKWKNGPVIKMADGTWVAYHGPTSSAQAQSMQNAAQKVVGSPIKRLGPEGLLKPVAVRENPVNEKPLNQGIDELRRMGDLPKDFDTAKHVQIAHEFLAKHMAGLHPFMQRLTDTAQGEGTVVLGRVKTLASAVGKVVRKPKYQTADRLFDGTGAQIVCENINTLKATVAALKKRFKTVPTEEEDFVTKPKMGYRSHHVIVIDDDGLPKEVQVRTPRQDTWAHWCHDVYKPQTDEQRAAKEAHSEAVWDYAKKMSEHYYQQDQGLPVGDPPPCPVAVGAAFGCLDAAGASGS